MKNRSALTVFSQVAAAFASLGAGMPLPTTAAFNVAPLRVEFGAGQQARDLLIRNDGETVLGVQIRVFAWSQDLAGDQYRLSQDFVISPSIVEIEPSQTQTLHLIAAIPAISVHQAAYRVVIDQLPGSVTALQGAAQTRLRVTIPLFAGGERAAQGQVKPAIARNRLFLANAGGRAIRLQNVTLHQDGKVLAFDGVNAPSYVLGGARVSFALPAGTACGSAITMSYEIDRVKRDAAVPQDCT